MNVLVIHSQVSTCHSQVSLYIIFYISTNAHERTPKDINLLIFRVFESSTTSEFTDHVKSVQSTLETSQLFGQNNKMTPEQIITAFENKYSDLLGQDQWVAKITTDSPSAFNAETSSAKICFNCGDLGHIVPECPKPRDENAIQQRRSILSIKINQAEAEGVVAVAEVAVIEAVVAVAVEEVTAVDVVMDLMQMVLILKLLLLATSQT